MIRYQTLCCMIPYFQMDLANIQLTKHMKWPVYNQSLVKKGEILLGFDIMNNWDTELKEMNKDNVGWSHFIILILSFFS